MRRRPPTVFYEKALLWEYLQIFHDKSFNFSMRGPLGIFLGRHLGLLWEDPLVFFGEPSKSFLRISVLFLLWEDLQIIYEKTAQVFYEQTFSLPVRKPIDIIPCVLWETVRSSMIILLDLLWRTSRPSRRKRFGFCEKTFSSSGACSLLYEMILRSSMRLCIDRLCIQVYQEDRNDYFKNAWRSSKIHSGFLKEEPPGFLKKTANILLWRLLLLWEDLTFFLHIFYGKTSRSLLKSFLLLFKELSSITNYHLLWDSFI